MYIRLGCLVAAILLCSGCGREERREATSLTIALEQQQAGMTSINGLEKDLVGSVRAWGNSVAAAGGGNGKALAENVATAKALSEAAKAVATQLSRMRQVIFDQPLKQEFAQSVRDTIVNQFMKRQRMLQEMRAALDGAATGFEEATRSRDYKGDTYPPGIDKLSAMMAAYHAPDDAVGKAIQSLKTKYTITDAEAKAKS